MNRRVCLVLALTALACSDPAPPPRVEPETPGGDPVDDTVAAADDAPRPTSEGTPPEDTVAVVALPDRPHLRLPTIRSRDEVIQVGDPAYGLPALTRPTVEHPDDAVAEWLNDTLTRELGARETNEGWHPDWLTVELTLAHHGLVSGWIETYEMWDRGEGGVVVDPYTYRIGDHELVRVDVRGAVLPGFDLDAAIRRSCIRREGGGNRNNRQECAEAPVDAQLTLAEEGVEAQGRDGESGPGPLLVPWRALDGAILADSVVGAALLEIDGARSVRVPRPPDSRGEPSDGAEVWSSGRLSEAFRAFHRAPPELRGGLRFATVDSDYVALVHPRGGEAANAIAQVLETEPRPIRWLESAEPVEVRAQTDTALRARPFDDEARLYLPAGTILTALRGRVTRRDSSFGARNTWAIASVNAASSGFIAGNLVAPNDGCVPPADAFLRELPDNRRRRAARTLLRASTELRRGSERRDVLLYASLTASHSRRRIGETRIAVYERRGECGVGRRLARWDLPGAYYALRLGSTTEHGGSPFLAAALSTGRDRARVAVYPVGRGDALLELDVGAELPEPEVSVGRGDDWAPLRVGATTYEWTGEALAPRE